MIDLDFLQSLIEALDASGLDSIELERGGTRIKLAKTPGTAVAVAAAPSPVAQAAVAPVPVTPAPATAAGVSARIGRTRIGPYRDQVAHGGHFLPRPGSGRAALRRGRHSCESLVTRSASSKQ